MGTLLTLVAFLIGSFPSGIVLGRLTTGRDPRTGGSGNFGAANVVRTAGWKVGAAVAVLDILKGVIPVLAAQRAGLSHAEVAVVAVVAVAGHDFSLFVGFKGGKGVATTLGVSLVLAPIATVLAMLAWAAVLVISGYTSLASLVSLTLLPFLMAVTGQPPAYVAASIVLLLLAAGKHWENIIRLAQGRESSFKKRRTGDGG